MKKLPKPQFLVSDIIHDCAEQMRCAQKKQSYTSAIPEIERHTNKLDKIMSQCLDVNFLKPLQLSNGVSKEDMEKLYSRHFASKSKDSRKKYYDKILNAAQSQKCPFCDMRKPSNLDHFLIKKEYIALTVSPINLVPMCRDCNTGNKGTYSFSKYSDSHLHPYYDDVTDEVWLKATIERQNDVIIPKYYTIKPSSYSDLLYKRVKTHFNIFKLNKEFSFEALDEIKSLSAKWKKNKTNLGAEGLKKDFEETIESLEFYSKNSWKVALYRSFLEEDWFIEEYL